MPYRFAVGKNIWQKTILSAESCIQKITKVVAMSPFRPWIIHFHRNLLATLICCYLLTSHVTGVFDDSSFKAIHELEFLRSLRSALERKSNGPLKNFN
ncbi:unnamed protein product, partial [Onchocerca flexuosa]|uniref:Transposase n=1 Tax=Onchocerca flexuosa TaxID=387005 RepID=A0A183HAY7_9BILA